MSATSRCPMCDEDVSWDAPNCSIAPSGERWHTGCLEEARAEESRYPNTRGEIE